jgi:GT2 family glycosyltransferase
MPVAIVGMHRSGTSMVAELLHEAGLFLGSVEDVLGAAPENPAGFWENARFIDLNEKLLNVLGGDWDLPPENPDWNGGDLGELRMEAQGLVNEFAGHEPWGWKDPRTSLTLPFWLDVVPELQVVICLRNPLEVALSLHERNYLSYGNALNLWKTYNERALQAARPEIRLITHFGAYFSDGEAEVRRLLEFCRLGCEPSLAPIRRSVRSWQLSEDDFAKVEVSPEVVELYKAMGAEAGRLRRRSRRRGPGAKRSDHRARAAGRLDRRLLDAEFFTRTRRIARERKEIEGRPLSIGKTETVDERAGAVAGQEPDVQEHEHTTQGETNSEDEMARAAAAQDPKHEDTTQGGTKAEDEMARAAAQEPDVQEHEDTTQGGTVQQPTPEVALPELALSSADVIVCVRDALEAVRDALGAFFRHTPHETGLILVDDGSDADCAAYLAHFARVYPKCTLIRNSGSGGYTRAANQGLRASSADFVVLLNSDAIVTPGWLDRLMECAQSDPTIGIVGPISNAASWQSVPELFDPLGDWVVNQVPSGWSIDEIAKEVAATSRRRFPRVSLVNGFCLGITRRLIDTIGYFDEDAFPGGYGEENDYCMKAVDAGFALAVADDAYVYHLKTQSYTDTSRRRLVKTGNEILEQRYGVDRVARAIEETRDNETLAEVRETIGTRLQRLVPRLGSERSEKFSVLFLLFDVSGGGGDHSIVQEAQGMRAMGVDAQIVVRPESLPAIERHYPSLVPGDLWYVYSTFDDLVAYAARFDAVVATIFWSVQALHLIVQRHSHVTPGFYVQDYEPWFFQQGSLERVVASEAYELVPDARLFAKTRWLCERVREEHGLRVAQVRPSLDHDIYFPYARRRQRHPVRIAAMVRVSTPRRAPERTLRVLERLKREFDTSVDIHVFGSDDISSLERTFDGPFDLTNHGLLTREQVADLLRDSEVFLDLSDYQAFGRTALEAMACGCAVVVPREGGASEFASDGVNALVVDTTDEEACYQAAEHLVLNPDLRGLLGAEGITTAADYSIPRAVLSELAVLTSTAHETSIAQGTSEERGILEVPATVEAESHDVSDDLTSPGQVALEETPLAVEETNDEAESTEVFTPDELESADLAAKIARLTQQDEQLRASVQRLNEQFDYLSLVRDVQEIAPRVLPRGARVLVVSRGDNALLDLGKLRVSHFPQAEAGVYAGHHPADDVEALGQLEDLERSGARFLLFPATAFWWLEHYTGLRRHLDEECIRVWADHRCVIYQLSRRPRVRLHLPRVKELDGRGSLERPLPYQGLVERVREIVEDVTPNDASVLVCSKGDNALVSFRGRNGLHFPQTSTGVYAGHYPADDDEAIAHVEELRQAGAAYLVFPSPSFWWLDHYGVLSRYLERHFRRVWSDSHCVVYTLKRRRIPLILSWPRRLPSGVKLGPATGSGATQPARDVRFALAFPVTRPLDPPATPFDPGRMVLHWILPDFELGMGGPMAIFRIIKGLETLGHECTVWIRDATQHGSPDEARRIIREHFQPIEAAVRIVGANVDDIAGDAVIATHSWTAYPARAVRQVRERFYLVQDFEPYFHPRGTHYFLAEATYRFGFTCLASSKWLEHLLASQYGCNVERFAYAYDESVYHIDPAADREDDRVVFYSRSRTPRRAVELGLLALELVALKRPALKVDFYGSPMGQLEVPYSYTDHGIVDDQTLARLYRRGTIGLVFSSTNCSLTPREMMACGLPVLELGTESPVIEFPPEAVTLAAPTPQDIAEKIESLLAHKHLREEQAENALRYVRGLSWEATAREVERGLVRGIEARETVRGASGRVAANGKPSRGRRGISQRPPGHQSRFEGPLVFAAQPEYYRSTYFDLVETGRHFEFPFTSADPGALEFLPDFAREKGAKTCIVYRPEWFIPHRDAFDELRARGIAVVGYSSEPVPHGWQGPVHPDQMRRLESLKRALELDYDLIIHYDRSSLELLRGIGFQRLIANPLPVSRKLFYPEERPKDFDVCFLGKSTPYREQMLLPLKMRFNTVHVAHGLRDEDARDLMNRSRLVLNLHNENYLNFENRVVQALFCRRPVVSEPLSGDLLRAHDDYVPVSSPEEVLSKVTALLNGWSWQPRERDLSPFTVDALMTKLGIVAY